MADGVGNVIGAVGDIAIQNPAFTRPESDSPDAIRAFARLGKIRRIATLVKMKSL